MQYKCITKKVILCLAIIFDNDVCHKEMGSISALMDYKGFISVRYLLLPICVDNYT